MWSLRFCRQWIIWTISTDDEKSLTEEDNDQFLEIAINVPHVNHKVQLSIWHVSFLLIMYFKIIFSNDFKQEKSINKKIGKN